LLPQAEKPVEARIPTAATAIMRLIFTTTPWGQWGNSSDESSGIIGDRWR
jgi:hypothetical protein